MTRFDEKEIQAVIARVRERLGGTPDRIPTDARAPVEVPDASLGEGIFATIDEAVDAAEHAQRTYAAAGTDLHEAVIASIRKAMLESAEYLAEAAHAETGLGRAEDKVRKNILVTTRTPGPEDLEPLIETGSAGMMVTEHAPFGLIGAVTPTTNPTSTIINNTIAILSGGNGVVFNVHPNAKRVSAENIRLINRAILSAGGPPNLVAGIPEPTIESAQALMHHPKVRVLLVTGGPGVVREALKTDKRAITAGPGNPPAVVDETADVEKAARDVVAGASFDNNVICTDEKTVIAVRSIADELVRAMGRAGGHVLKEHELKKVERVIFETMGPPGKPGVINRSWIGKDARDIAAAAGVDVDGDPRVLVADVPNEHNLVWTEQMMPVLPVTRVPDVDAAIELAIASEHRFRHTASIHSTNVSTITRMARSINVSIFIANGPNYAGLGQGGEGFTSFSIASPTGDGMTRPITFTRERRIAVVGALRIV
ncbi:MAG TPA: aldehyde dehydrogenase family protein [Acidimicrobiia bacterium]|nr:aldehyde dehydrogenase family protein [Acidimicrobiia bacterium]